ncbi:MAG: hypothetical protein K6F31_10390 [Acetatifactor sp.]|nr:hypothetical protein [Acetatifactor sp.]
MKKCNKCGIIVQDDFYTCPNCKGVSFTQTDIEDASKKDDLSAIKSFPGSSFQAGQGEKAANYGNVTIFLVFEIIGSCLCLLGLFLPFIKVTVLGTVFQKAFNELDPNDVIIYVLISIAGLVFACLKWHRLVMAAGALYGILLYVNTYDYFENIRQSEVGSAVAKGTGFYCIVIGIILMIAFGVVSDHMKRKK